ncbi:MAG TPA: MlaE family lipid ABC transporter permease subunit [Alphaproteobacteria bacterium]|nr:MlaE family lipid ABC transporter permease subunit [Alphaproteobacteria bacterium]
MRARRSARGAKGSAHLITETLTASGSFALAREGEAMVLRLAGPWTLAGADLLATQLAAIETGGVRRLRVDFSEVTALDAAGAWILFRFMRHAEGAGTHLELAGQSEAQAALLRRMTPVIEERKSLARPLIPPIRAMVERVGHATFEFVERAFALVSFFGVVALVLLRTIARPRQLRFISLLSHVERIGLDAMPIVGLLSFLIGVVLAYQGAEQLRAYGAEIFTINLLGVSVLRELGVLLTAIMVAGRSGSAFTAEIGTMQVNEEVDALRTLGLDPIEVLVLPRLLAMMVALPLLAFFADMMALLGGAIMALVVLDISSAQFVTQFKEAIIPRMFWVGIVKAPFFAFLIAMVGCFEGLQVQGSAESVGRLTTKSVVESIFLVIVADAAFSIFFSYIRI